MMLSLEIYLLGSLLAFVLTCAMFKHMGEKVNHKHILVLILLTVSSWVGAFTLCVTPVIIYIGNKLIKYLNEGKV